MLPPSTSTPGDVSSYMSSMTWDYYDGAEMLTTPTPRSVTSRRSDVSSAAPGSLVQMFTRVTSFEEDLPESQTSQQSSSHTHKRQQSSRSPGVDTAAHTKWIREDELLYTDELVSSKFNGEASEKGFKNHVWTCIVNKINTRHPHHQKIDAKLLKNKYNYDKKAYTDVKSLKEMSGISWDAEAGLVIGSDQFWAELPNRWLAKWQKKKFPHFENWAIIVGDTRADGRDIVLPGGLDASFDVDDMSEVDQPDESADEHTAAPPSRRSTSSSIVPSACMHRAPRATPQAALQLMAQSIEHVAEAIGYQQEDSAQSTTDYVMGRENLSLGDRLKLLEQIESEPGLGRVLNQLRTEELKAAFVSCLLDSVGSP